MIAFRVCKFDDSQIGMYAPAGIWIDYHNHDRHPPPGQDSKLVEAIEAKLGSFHILAHYYFGFSTLEQFSAWVYNRDLQIRLSDAGFRLAVFETEHLIVGSTQAIFTLGPRLDHARVEDYESLRPYQLTPGASV